MKSIILSPVKESSEEYEAIEEEIARLFKREIYLPLIEALGLKSRALQNKLPTVKLIEAIQSGRISFSRGRFRGKFSAAISRELKLLGAKWDRNEQSWRVTLSSMPKDLLEEVRAADARYDAVTGRIDKKLSQIIPDDLAAKLKINTHLESVLKKVDQKIHQTLKGITVTPQLSSAGRKKIADEWQHNMKLWIKDWTAQEIRDLRQKVKKHVYAGERYEALARVIKQSHGVSGNKAKFLARQETNLLMAKFKESRYVEAGVTEYIWGCVAGSALHPVRPSHKRLEGKKFRFDKPPIVSEPGKSEKKCNPGQDDNCRCFARPVVTF